MEISEDYQRCIKTLHFGNRVGVGVYLYTEVMVEGVQGGRWAKAAVLWKELGAVGVCEGSSPFLKKFRKSRNKLLVPQTLR